MDPELPRWLPRHAAVAVLAVCTLFLPGAWAQEEEGDQAPAQPPTPVRTDPIRSETLQEKTLVTGSVRAAQRSLIAAEEPGIVAAMPVREGQIVEGGAVIARLDAARLEIELKAVEAEAEVARAALEERRSDAVQKERDLEILRGLAAEDASNPRELADAETAWKIALSRVTQTEHQIRATEARRDLLRARVADTEIRAPFAGMVVARHSEVGQWIAKGSPVVELVSTGDLEAWLEVSQEHFTACGEREGAIRIRVDASGETFEGKDCRVVRQMDPRTRNFFVIAHLPEASATVPGMSLTAWVPTGRTGEHLTVSTDAILRNEAGPFIYVVMPGEGGAPAAMPVPVQVLFGVGDRVAIRGEGIQAGAQAIREGNERLFPMTPVTLVLDEAGAEEEETPR